MNMSLTTLHQVIVDLSVLYTTTIQAYRLRGHGVLSLAKNVRACEITLLIAYLVNVNGYVTTVAGEPTHGVNFYLSNANKLNRYAAMQP
jgi:hypothetical protein